MSVGLELLSLQPQVCFVKEAHAFVMRIARSGQPSPSQGRQPCEQQTTQSKTARPNRSRTKTKQCQKQTAIAPVLPGRHVLLVERLLLLRRGHRCLLLPAEHEFPSKENREGGDSNRKRRTPTGGELDRPRGFRVPDQLGSGRRVSHGGGLLVRMSMIFLGKWTR